jgi:hypothetical protein
MSGTELLLLATSVVVVGAAGVALLLYKNELDSARAVARRGSLVANTDAGPIEYADKGAGIPLLSIHGAGGALGPHQCSRASGRGLSDHRAVAFRVSANAGPAGHLCSRAGRRACGVALQTERSQDDRDRCFGRCTFRS